MPLLFKTLLAAILKLVSTPDAVGSHTYSEIILQENMYTITILDVKNNKVCNIQCILLNTTLNAYSAQSHQMYYTYRQLAPSAIRDVFRNVTKTIRTCVNNSLSTFVSYLQRS